MLKIFFLLETKTSLPEYCNIYGLLVKVRAAGCSFMATAGVVLLLHWKCGTLADRSVTFNNIDLQRKFLPPVKGCLETS